MQVCDSFVLHVIGNPQVEVVTLAGIVAIVDAALQMFVGAEFEADGIVVTALPGESPR